MLDTEILKVDLEVMIDINITQEIADLNNRCIIVSNSEINVNVYDSRHHANQLSSIG